MQRPSAPRSATQVTGKWLALVLALLVAIGVPRRADRSPYAGRTASPKPSPPSCTRLPTAQAAGRPKPPPPLATGSAQPQPAPARTARRRPRREPEGRCRKPDHAIPRDIALKARQEEERRKKDEAARKEAGRAKARAQQEADERQKRRGEEESWTPGRSRARQQRADASAARAGRARERSPRAGRPRRAARAATQRAGRSPTGSAASRPKVKGNVIMPPDMAGNPEAIFEVVQLPTGEIIDVQLRKSSGVRAYDDAGAARHPQVVAAAASRARLNSFQRSLTLKFRPTD